ncbi:NAD(P)-dependent oxidoreductase [Roseomonas sp. KE2513]|uniref:NAD(P)-dependent oxidoreductase n=1 Tax=Roseomonas sp. KE2513 TaxID=2479202 RepID=UPI0018DF234C|nr:NAD(P)-dependent oxidoreductase [Roseomonas sp. KE2513]
MILYSGLGRMGLPMACHARDAGHAVIGFDPSAERRSLFVAKGGQVVTDPSGAYPQAEAVVIMVGSERQAEEIITGEGGIVACCRPGTLVLVISTVAPEFVARMGAVALAAGIRVVDAPVCRAEMGAIAGTLLAFLSGPDADCHDAAALMKPYVADVEIVGTRLGAAQIAKTVNNMILWACAMANEEGLRLAAAWDLDLASLRRALVTSSANNWALQHWDRAGEMPWSIKDMEIALKSAMGAGVSVPLSEAVNELVRRSQVLRHA